MNFVIKDARPIWQQLADQITMGILTDEYAPGQRFPSVRELSAAAGVNPNTMQRALAKLEDEGLLITIRSSGRTVTSDLDVLNSTRTRYAKERVGEFISDMERLGYSQQNAAKLVMTYGKDE